jgi:hypothetical protein
VTGREGLTEARICRPTMCQKEALQQGQKPPPALPAETLQATTFQPDAPESEAHRIAAELVRLHKDGTIRSQADASRTPTCCATSTRPTPAR